MNESNMELDLINRQVAIKALERKKDKNAKGDIGGFYNKIIQNDIDALMQLPSAQPDVPDTNVGDIISRQAAIDALHGYFDGMLETDTWSPCDVYGLIEALPSAQPEPCEDAVSRKGVAEAVEYYKKSVHHILGDCEFERVADAIHGLIRALPPAQPEIIKCRDCKYWDKTWTNDWAEDYHYCPMVDGVRKADFYCADAERITDE